MRRRRRTVPYAIGGVVALLALLALAYTPDLPPEELEARYASPASQFLLLDAPGLEGARVHLRDEGRPDGPVVLLVHGSNSSLHTWEPWVERLGDAFRLVRFDLPGHGLTGSIPSGDYSQDNLDAFTLAVADDLGLERFAIAGSSMGGGVAWRLALKAPERIERIVLVAAAGVTSPEPQPLPLAFRLASTPGLNRGMRWVAPLWLYRSAVRASFHDQSLVTDEMVRRYRDLGRYPGNRAATVERFSQPWDSPLQERLGDIAAPTLILWGAEDRVTPLSLLEVYRAAMPDATVVVCPEVGHLPHEEAADETAEEVRAFLGAD